MTPVANHAGEQVLLAAAIGSGVFSGSLLLLRAGIADLARRRWRRHP